MVLESLITPLRAEKHPWEMFFIGLIYSTIAVFISIQIFEEHAGLVAVFLTVMACIPIMYATIKLEEKKDSGDSKEMLLLKEHAKAISFFVFLFFGIMLSFVLWYVFLPESSVQNLFSIQINTIRAINSSAVLGFPASYAIFLKILANNLKVLMFCILFAFFYGAGAIFILTWNASVIAVAIGAFFRKHIAVYAQHVGLTKMAGYLHIFSLGIIRYMTHGLPEVLAYFTAGLAGGIISVAAIKHNFKSKEFFKVVLDSADLIMISVLLLVIAALVEVWVTPSLF